MTREEALDIIAKMKSGKGFSDEDPIENVFWSYTYDQEENTFNYMEIWTVTGVLLESSKRSETEFTDFLMANYEYAELMGGAFTRGKKLPKETKPKSRPPWEASDFRERVFSAIQAGDRETITALVPDTKTLKKIKSVRSKHSPLTFACMHGQAGIVDYLLKIGADPNRRDGRSELPISAACDGYNPANMGEVVRLLIGAGAAVPQHKKGKDGALHHAAMYGSTEAVKLLIEHGAPADQPGGYGRTPLMYAAADGKSVEMVDFLIKAGANVNAKNEGGDNALFDAVTRDNPSAKVAAKLIDAGLNIHYVHPSYKTILGWAANCGKKEIVELLLKRGADVNAENKRNESPIAQAMMSGHHEIVKILFAAGADPESKNFGGWSLLEYATEKKDEPLVRAIMERLERKKPAGKQTVAERDQKSEALAKAAEKGDTSMLGLLIRQGANINGLSRWGDETPLMKAAYYGKTEAAAWLIDHGATIEARDSRGNTALLHAAWMGKVGVVELLLKKGADVNALNNLGWNALMQAALEGHHETAKILLEHGARTDFIDKEKGATAYYLAQRSGSGKTLEVLKEYGAQPRVWRALKPGEPCVDIRECEYCQYIPQGKELANAESLGDYPGLIQLHTHSTEVDRYATSTIDVFKCKLCWSYYQNDHYIDTEDSFVAGPTIHRHLQRFNFERLKMALLEYQLTEENAEFSARLPHLIATMKEVLAREGSAIHPHFLRHFIENVTDSYILAGDWERLKRDLLSHTDKKLALRVADDLIIIFGEGKYASAGGEQVYKAYRHITPDVYEQTKKILAAHSQELKDILKAIRAEGGGKAVDDVLKSAKYYKI